MAGGSKVYRTGRHWGVTIVECTSYPDTEQVPAYTHERLLGMATSPADAENICEALNLLTRLAAARGREIVDIIEQIRGERPAPAREVQDGH